MKHNEIDEKLWDFLHGNADGPLCSEVEEWMNKSPENKAYFSNFRRDALHMRWALRRKLIRRAGYEEMLQHASRRCRMRRSMYIAASVLLAFGLGLATWLIPPDGGKKELLAEAVDIHPGKSQATLFLSQGQKMPLTTEGAEWREQDGTTIRVGNNGQVCYFNPEGNHLPHVIFNKIVTPRGGEFGMELSDGTKVWLNAATELRYPTQFVGASRVVYLKGEAYFAVKSDPSRPFIVVADSSLRIEVVGTKFNVNTYLPGEVEVVLVEGALKVGDREEAVKLLPGQRALYAGRGLGITVDPVEVTPYVAWKDGNFVFQHESLEEIMEKLSLWYDFDVIYMSDDLKSIRLSGDMKRYNEISDLLYYFERSSALKFKIRNRTIIVGRR